MIVTAAVVAAFGVIAVKVRPRATARTRARGRARGSGEQPELAVLESIARELRTGSSLPSATITALRSTPTCLRSVRADLERSASLAAALDRADPVGGERVLVSALRACAAGGGAMSATVDRALVVLRERAAFARERTVHAAQARLSALVMTLVPIVFSAWSIAASPRIRAVYAHAPVAAALAVVGLLLNASGWLWMRRLTQGPRR
jgi:Flp pilus assembly protein TadB